MTPIKKELARLFFEAVRAHSASVTAEEAEASFQAPKDDQFGDLSTHLALKLAKELKRPPRPLAEALSKEIWNAAESSESMRGRLDKISVEGPGFLNFYYSPKETAGVLGRIRAEGEVFGRPPVNRKRNILLEFVSANPTGPLTVAHGRQAALGDSLARILKFCGHDVTKEYYNNDEGVQITTLGLSTELRLRQICQDGAPKELPENYYQGAYLVEIAEKLLKSKPEILKASDKDRLETCRIFARDEIMAGIKVDLNDFDVHFDNYYSQEALGKSGKVEKTLEELKKKGVVYESEGAVWLRSTDFGDDKDRVLVKSDKNYTYLTPDIAYHHEKFNRGYDEIIDILGPDHHGYIARLKASQAALGHDPERVNVLIAQLVTLYDGPKQVRMSTRAGEFVTLRQILDEVGRDAGRFFFVMRKFDAHLDFDLELAKSQTQDNPVFYIQYAHARIESVKNTYREKFGAFPDAVSSAASLARLSTPSEIRVLRLLSQFEDAVGGAANTLEPYRLVPYLMDLAGAFHRFYTENRVVTDDAELTAARALLAEGVQTVLRQGLALLGVSAPLKM